MIRETINKNLEDLTKVVHIVQKFLETGILPDIEKDIAILKLQSVYEFMEQVQAEKTLKGGGLGTTEKKHHEAKVEPGPTQANKEKIIAKNLQEEPITPKVSVVPEKKRKDAVRSKTQNSKIQTEHIPAAKTGILADTFKQNSFLNEALSQYNNMFDISRKMQSRPLKDIFSAISLNEKFVFIKELFNNNATLYEGTIEKLNAASDFNEAVRYLDQRFELDFDEEQVQKLLELVRRRYAPAN